jgi:phage terminase large subunit-like protein
MMSRQRAITSFRAWDTAFEKNQRADYSAVHDVGYFTNEEDNTAQTSFF